MEEECLNEGDVDNDIEDDLELISVLPWQAPYAWDMIRGEVDVPCAVHEAAVKWWVRQFSSVE
jgi:hypothetical protein